MQIAITGHRPDKLGGYDFSNPIRQDLFRRLITELQRLNPSMLFVGGALGFDTDAARAALKCKIPYTLCAPFPSQARRWNDVDRQKYEKMKEYADRVVFVSENDPPVATGVNFAAINMLHARNRYMVDQGDQVIAAWDGSLGGIHNCVKYAKKVGKEILVLEPEGITYVIPSSLARLEV